MRTLWQTVQQGGVELLFSAVTLAEVLIKPADGSAPPWPDPNPFDEVFENDRLTLLQVDRLIGERARSLRRMHRIKTPDALHLACALEHNVDQMITRDGWLLTKSGFFARKDGRPLMILTPDDALGGPLWAGKHEGR
jgi:PIN domain nuclease of toxin-antitoxin system